MNDLVSDIIRKTKAYIQRKNNEHGLYILKFKCKECRKFYKVLSDRNIICACVNARIKEIQDYNHGNYVIFCRECGLVPADPFFAGECIFCRSHWNIIVEGTTDEWGKHISSWWEEKEKLQKDPLNLDKIPVEWYECNH